jgi:hypothetical protein
MKSPPEIALLFYRGQTLDKKFGKEQTGSVIFGDCYFYAEYFCDIFERAYKM